MPANIEVMGAKVYWARNPKWTKLGKAGKSLYGPRANGQKPSLEGGTARQRIIRNAFAMTAYNNLYGHYGKDERGMPIVANIMASQFPSNLRKSPEAMLQERRQRAAASHARTGAKLSAGAAGPMIGGEIYTGEGYPF